MNSHVRLLVVLSVLSYRSTCFSFKCNFNKLNFKKSRYIYLYSVDSLGFKSTFRREPSFGIIGPISQLAEYGRRGQVFFGCGAPLLRTYILTPGSVSPSQLSSFLSVTPEELIATEVIFWWVIFLLKPVEIPYKTENLKHRMCIHPTVGIAHFKTGIRLRKRPSSKLSVGDGSFKDYLLLICLLC